MKHVSLSFVLIFFLSLLSSGRSEIIIKNKSSNKSKKSNNEYEITRSLYLNKENNQKAFNHVANVYEHKDEYSRYLLTNGTSSGNTNTLLTTNSTHKNSENEEYLILCVISVILCFMVPNGIALFYSGFGFSGSFPRL